MPYLIDAFRSAANRRDSRPATSSIRSAATVSENLFVSEPVSKPAVRRRILLAASPVAVVAVLLTGCGASAKSSPTTSNSASAQASSGQRRFPGASGELVAMSGSTLQVQNTSSQTTVSYSASTTFTKTVAASASAVAVGLCATARPAATPSSSPSPSGSGSTRPTAFTAATVLLTAPVNGDCGFGRAGQGGQRPSGLPSRSTSDGNGQPPSAGAAASGGRGLRGGAGFGATGKIISVTGTSFVVENSRPPRASGQPGSTTPATTDVTVSTTPTTTFRQTVKASSSALSIGSCVTAMGRADDTGAIAATSIAVQPKMNGTCGFGGPGA
jgi:hypothetical protein